MLGKVWSIFYRHRSHIIVKGLGRIGSGGPRDANVVKNRITSLLNEVGSTQEFTVEEVIVYGQGNPVYNVALSTEKSVTALLSAFSRFIRRRDPVPRPSSLDGVALHHAVTPGTRVRISLLRVSNFELRV